MLRPQCRAALQSSLTARILYRRARTGTATAMSIPFAPEPEPEAEVLLLEDDQPAESLPLGFEFEFFGERYARFDLSAEGLIAFRAETPVRSSGSYPSHRHYSSIALGWSDLYPLRDRRVAYEVRGDASRRRLVLSLAGTPNSYHRGVGRLTAQLVLYERTGMIDVHTRCEDASGSSLDREALRFTTAPW